MNAIILSGGFGKRLAPLTDKCPKPMLTVANRPMLDYTFGQLKYYGIGDVTLTLAYKPEAITSWTDGYKRFNCHYSIEERPLGTAGGVKNAKKYLGNTFFVLSGDGLNNIDLNKMYESHLKSGADVTMAITPSDTPQLYGVVEYKNGLVRSFKEKPQDAVGTKWINTGVYIINKYVLDYVPSEETFDFSRDLFPFVLAKGSIGVYEHRGYWTDIGDFSSYFRANFDMLKGGFYTAAYNIYDDTSSELFGGYALSLVSKSASVVGRISGSIVGRGSRVASGAVLDKCIVLDDTIVNGRYTDSIISGDTVINVGSEPFNPKIFKKNWNMAVK